MTTSSALLRTARREAGLTQRALARAAGVPQPTVARIESGAVEPRVGTLERLLARCGRSLSTVPRTGSGVDRTLIRARLRLTVAERARAATDEWRSTRVFDRTVRT